MPQAPVLTPQDYWDFFSIIFWKQPASCKPKELWESFPASPPLSHQQCHLCSLKTYKKHQNQFPRISVLGKRSVGAEEKTIPDTLTRTDRPVHLSWHWRSPSSATPEFHKPQLFLDLLLNNEVVPHKVQVVQQEHSKLPTGVDFVG